MKLIDIIECILDNDLYREKKARKKLEENNK